MNNVQNRLLKQRRKRERERERERERLFNGVVIVTACDSDSKFLISTLVSYQLMLSVSHARHKYSTHIHVSGITAKQSMCNIYLPINKLISNHHFLLIFT